MLSYFKFKKKKTMKEFYIVAPRKSCQKKTNVLNTRIPINDYLFIFYKLLTGHSYAQIERDVNVSLKTITVIRKRLRHIMSFIWETRIC